MTNHFEPRSLAGGPPLAGAEGPLGDGQAVGGGDGRLAGVGVDGEGDVGPPVLADGPEADGVGDRRRPARGQAELHAGGGVDRGRAGEADGEGLAHPEVGRGEGGAGQLGEQAVAEEGEGDLEGEVALVEGEGEVGEGPPAVGAP